MLFVLGSRQLLSAPGPPIGIILSGAHAHRMDIGNDSQHYRAKTFQHCVRGGIYCSISSCQAHAEERSKGGLTTCPPCLTLVEAQCFGGHVKHQQPCSQSHTFSCAQECGRPLDCGNHTCSKQCHPYFTGITGMPLDQGLNSCNGLCLKPGSSVLSMNALSI